MKFKLGFFPHGAATVFYDTLTYQGTDNSTTNGTSYSFSSKSIGAANSNRRVIVGVALPDGDDTTTAVTVGGVSATELGQINGVVTGASLWIAAVPTGTTATIAVTVGSTTTSIKIGWWTVNMTSNVAHQVVTAEGEESGDFWVDVPGVEIPLNGFSVSVCSCGDPAIGPNLAINQSYTESGDGTVEGDFGASFALKEGSFSGTVRWTATQYDHDPVAVIATFKGNGT